MPRIMDLSREREIRALRAEGLGVRQIARQVHCSPSTVSRLLRGSVAHSTLGELTARVSHIEQTQELIGQKLHALWQGGALSPSDRRAISDLFLRRPESKR